MKISTRRGPAALAAIALAMSGAAGPAYAATPLSAPGTPAAANVTTTSVRFAWTAPPGPVATYTVQTIDVVGSPWRDLATTTATAYTHSGLVPDAVYEYRVIANPVGGSGYTASDPSALLWVRTAPLPDSAPPTRPGVPRANPVTTVMATVTFGFSTDNRRVDAYWVQRQINGVWTDWATNNITTVYLRDLAPDTAYTIAVVAVDANGNRSERSDPLTFTTRAVQPAPTCRTQLILAGTQYQAIVFVDNMTAATVVENWTIRFTFPAGQAILYSFNGTTVRDGAVGIETPMWYIGRVGPGGSVYLGFLATLPAGSPLPSGFTLTASAGVFPCPVM